MRQLSEVRGLDKAEGSSGPHGASRTARIRNSLECDSKVCFSRVENTGVWCRGMLHGGGERLSTYCHCPISSTGLLSPNAKPRVRRQPPVQKTAVVENSADAVPVLHPPCLSGSPDLTSMIGMRLHTLLLENAMVDGGFSSLPFLSPAMG